MARRGENIFHRKDGRWEARIAAYRPDGQRTYRSLYGKTYREVKQKKEEYCTANTGRTQIAVLSPLFSEIAVQWLTGVKGTVKESTFTRYHRIVYSYLQPTLGGCGISRIDSLQLDRFREMLCATGGKRGNGLSEKTVTDILSVLNMILSHAVRAGYNVPAAGAVRRPRRVKREISVLSDEEIKRLEEILLHAEDRLALGILLTLHTGIRNGELCGLRWGDFDFHAQTVRISRTVERIAALEDPLASKTKIVISEPKTDTSRREIPLPSSLSRYLQAYRGAPDTHLLTGTDKPSEPHTLYVRYVRFLKRNGFVHYTFHALRHTFATRGAAAGVDIKSLSEILGHSDVTTTLRTYVHPSVEQKRQQMETVFSASILGQEYGVQTEK